LDRRLVISPRIDIGFVRARFPRCGGILLWMGHDSFPCPANTAIIDFWGRPKPALAVGGVWKGVADATPPRPS